MLDAQLALLLVVRVAQCRSDGGDPFLRCSPFGCPVGDVRFVFLFGCLVGDTRFAFLGCPVKEAHLFSCLFVGRMAWCCSIWRGLLSFGFLVLRWRWCESVMLAPISLVGTASRAAGCDPRCFPSIYGFLVQVNYSWSFSSGIAKIVALWVSCRNEEQLVLV